ncbi:MAG TPA: beta-glucosidase [Oscillatoriaceae cyanobacterium M7585_C2015_266]|nr:beta-glucosidase [Oscillatoriaceae cyanobacterium M7585_C2015_266]
MFVIRASGHLFDQQIRFPIWEPPASELRYLLQEVGVGGVLLPVGNAGELTVRAQQLQAWAKYPLLIASDIEEGVGQRFEGATWFPPPMALGALAAKDITRAQQYAEEMGSVTACEALALGLNWILAPVVDVNNNPDNPVINIRSFGETPEIVSSLVSAFIRGARKWPILTTAKHFPGHGDTAVDSHLQLPVLPHSPERLNTIELPPFAAALAAGVDAVMSAHLVISCWDAEKPATLSEKILTGQLRQKLGFDGLIVTDALVMGALANKYAPEEAPLLALEAGADILLMPLNPAAAIKAVCDAVAKARISPARIRKSVERIWKAKRRIYEQGSEKNSNCSTPTVQESRKTEKQPPAFIEKIATPAAAKTVTSILRETMITGGTLPLRLEQSSASAGLRNLILVDDLLNCGFIGYHTPAIAFPQKLGYQLILADTQSAATQIELLRKSPVPTLLQMFIRGNAFRDSAALTAAAENLFKTLLISETLIAIAIYGSPYILERFLTLLPANIPYVFSYAQSIPAQALALETLFGCF